ncbi:phosphatidylinositol glycan anchor biosynthesis class U protein [Morus notabilis]|uniref:phosphatidylinositol glycan anchor biosynthesis class U protein n=1 Tax=Morus notabilis TaxID=981085 RepID=UPI000CECF78F|nr:phosphatidylinositol glycan anchor biosynthesis class U protein [Morus notabilis]
MAAKEGRFWGWAFASVIFRLILIYFPNNLNLSSRPEVSTPLTSLRRLAEGYWLKQSSLSPYAGSMYHGSPLLLYVLGPLTAKRIEGQLNHLLCGLVFVIADVVNALLIRVIGQNLQISYNQRLKALSLDAIPKEKAILPSRDIAALVYLWNPFTIVSCVGLSTSPIENMAVILSLYGACTRKIPLAAFGWVMATHLSLYPMILIIPVILLLGYGPETPPRKLFDGKVEDSASSNHSHRAMKQQGAATIFSWKPVLKFLMWSVVWSIYVLVLCGLCVRHYGGLHEMFKRTYGFILTVPDLSPNIGVLWYFFAEVFEFFRNFFLIVFHMNILFMVLPLAIRLNHRPCFLAFVYIAISSMLKSYPSVGDAALYLGLLGLFVNELADMQFSFFLFCVYVGVSLLSPVMHNLWIWRGTGNANFYFATAMAYACFQIVLVVESVSAMLSHDRKLKKLSIAKHQESKS